MYAHGIDDINRTTVVDCKYGINCYDEITFPFCIFHIYVWYKNQI